jgi:hypothetical protein
VKKNPRDILVFCPWSVSKFSPESGQLVKIVKDRLIASDRNPRFLFHITGGNTLEKFHGKFIEFIEPHIGTDYITSEGGLTQFYQFMDIADIAILSTPYTGYTTVIDALQANTPIFAIDHQSHFITRVGAKILELAGRCEWVATSPDQLADAIVAYLDNPTKLTPLNMEEFVSNNNALMEREFAEWFNKDTQKE